MVDQAPSYSTKEDRRAFIGDRMTKAGGRLSWCPKHAEALTWQAVPGRSLALAAPKTATRGAGQDEYEDDGGASPDSSLRLASRQTQRQSMKSVSRKGLCRICSSGFVARPPIRRKRAVVTEGRGGSPRYLRV